MPASTAGLPPSLSPSQGGVESRTKHEVAVCYKTPGGARGRPWPLSQSRLPQSHSHTHSVKASVPAGTAIMGPRLPVPLQGCGERPRCCRSRLEGEKLAWRRKRGWGWGREEERQARSRPCQACWLPLEVTQPRLGALTVRPLENGGQGDGKRVGLASWDFGGSQCHHYLQSISPIFCAAYLSAPPTEMEGP